MARRIERGEGGAGAGSWWDWRLFGVWVLVTLVPAFVGWLVVIAPGAVDLLGRGSDTITAFLDGFVQALRLGPLIGMSQATALRGHTSRWAWWLAANVITYLSGAALHEAAGWVQEALSLPARAPGFFPVLARAVSAGPAWALGRGHPRERDARVPAVRSLRPAPGRRAPRCSPASARSRRSDEPLTSARRSTCGR